MSSFIAPKTKGWDAGEVGVEEGIWWGDGMVQKSAE